MSRLLFILGSLLLVFGVFTWLLGLAGFVIHHLQSESSDRPVPVGLIDDLIPTSILAGLGVLCLLLSRLVQHPRAVPAEPSADRLRTVEDVLVEHHAERYDAVARRLAELDDILAELGEYLAAHPPGKHSPPNRQALQELFDRARTVRELYP